MDEFSILIGGQAGFGIDKSAGIIGRLLNRLGYRIYIYRDYPSLIRGGHTFSVIRISKNRVACSAEKIDLIVALNQETLSLHKDKLKEKCFFIFDSDQVKIVAEAGCGIGIPLSKILKEEGAVEIMRNTCIIGGLAKAIGLEFAILEDILKKEFVKDLELNLKVSRRGFDEAKELIKIKPLQQESLPLVSGNQAIALGLVKGGLDAYLAYPMTPSSPILHYLAEVSGEFGLKVIHPESEIGVVLMALGFAYAGKKTAVGTSGGGFCLMTEGLSFSGMAELPTVIVLGQRPGPSTGLPTYSSQTELQFALSGGQGEFVRFIVAPADAQEAYYWSAVAMQLSWKYQIPSIILSDKDMGEGIFNFDLDEIAEIKEEAPILWEGEPVYQRYAVTDSGVSVLAFPGAKGAIIKVSSYEHDESGITTEDAAKTVLMQDKRLRKEKLLAQDLENFKTVNIHSSNGAETALVCWGSNKGVCVEVAQRLKLKVIQPVVLNPFPVKQFQEALAGTKKVICVENNATGQLAKLIKGYGFNVDKLLLKYDGRPNSADELQRRLKEII